MAKAYISNIEVNKEKYIIKDAEARESISQLSENVNQDIAKLSGDIEQIGADVSADIAALNYTDSAEAGKYVSSVSETNGVIAVTKANLPTELADFNEDASHRLVTDNDKAAWNNKVTAEAGSGLIPDAKLTQITTNADAITVLKGSGKGSIEKMINDAIDEFASQLSDNDIIDTYSEALMWIQENENGFTNLAGQIANKVEKESGKGLSTNDFTTAYKEKLDSLYINPEMRFVSQEQYNAVENKNDGVFYFIQ